MILKLSNMLVFFAVLLSGAFLYGCNSKPKTLVPKHEVIVSKNGVPIYFFPNKNIPLFQVELVFEGGSEQDPVDRAGLTAFAMHLTTKGVEGFTEDAYSRREDDLATDVDVGVSESRTTISAYGLNEKAPEVLDLLFRTVTSPTFPEAPFLRMQSNQIDSLDQITDSPSAIASRAIDFLVFNGTSKWRPNGGFRKDVKNLSVDQLKARFKSLIRTDKLKVLVIGGKNRKLILNPLLSWIEKLPCEFCAKPAEPIVSLDEPRFKQGSGEVLVLSRPGMPEAHVRMGQVMPGRNVKEFYDLRVAEAVLSGNFSSRLNLIIREKLNLTYSIGARFHFDKDIGSFLISTSTRTEKAGEMIAEVGKILADFSQHGPTDTELEEAKQFLIGSFPLSLQNMFGVAETYFLGVMNGLDPQFIDEYRSRIAAVSKDSVAQAFRKYVNAEKMKTVVVGEVKPITQQLKKQGLKYKQLPVTELL